MIKCFFEDGAEASLRHVTADTLVIKDNKLLMVKRSKKLSEGGKWGLVGGYADRDETVKETALREIYEETGWEVESLTFLRLKHWPTRAKEDRQNICFVFFCRGVKQTGTPDWESDEIKWYDLDNLPASELIAFDHADDIKAYKAYLKDKSTLPSYD